MRVLSGFNVLILNNPTPFLLIIVYRFFLVPTLYIKTKPK